METYGQREPSLLPLIHVAPTLVRRKEAKENPPDYNSILQMHFKIFGTDGVSWEVNHLSDFLALNDKNVFFCSGDVPKEEEAANRGIRIPGLNYQSPEIEDLTNRAFTRNGDLADLQGSEENLLAEIQYQSLEIERQVENYINDKNVGVVDVRNLFSLPYNLPATLAMYRLMERRKELSFLLHHHDFIWEWKDRIEKFKSPYASINKLVEMLYPPKADGPGRHHIVINSLAEIWLKQQGIQNTTVLSDSFDFGRHTPYDHPAKGEEYLKEMKEDLWNSLGINKNDVVIGSMTRVLPRKRIELTIQLISEMQKIKNSKEVRERIEESGGEIAINNGVMTHESEFVLLLCQNEDLKDNLEYYESLKAYAKERGVKLVLAGDRIKQKPDVAKNGQKAYSFLDAYFIVNGVDFPSEHEGFGNQFLELIWGRHIPPILEYLVFQSDIKPYIKPDHYIHQGFPANIHPLPNHTFGRDNNLYQLDEGINARAAREWLNMLMQPEKYRQYAEENLESIRQKFDSKIVGQNYLNLLTQLQEVAEKTPLPI